MRSLPQPRLPAARPGRVQQSILFAFAALCLATGAQATSCDAATTQRDMNACAGTSFKDQDKKLNAVYNGYRARLDANQKKLLKDAQVAWLKFRDLSCEFQASGVEGGSVQPMIVSECLAAMTAERVKQLQALDSCKEGDLSCPAPK
ncbi:uncharacterized protein YecT (DUF1311 family) [Pseudoduganella lurida]|uniref:Uncharacterized protein YecT (DUF1311 family) n=1 Tax=Pseudoduganella lurida TaxID=1036180 RepID=A0A562RFU8_9BURK|nr:lysozyme inhibitor LprI family protein [Pseudoduganella lurida]TWI67753.1 uncharacterized protein YecT (DUF1311 family) [Pseudoduganella lurida]